MNEIFISYSRRQYYFVELLVDHLQEQGLDIWFDVERLQPGLGWAEGIKRGLEESSALLLVVSQDALASAYVTQEWQAALRSNKPIHLFVFEGVQLPPVLAHAAASIVTRSGRFADSAERLGQALAGQAAPRDPVPGPGPLRAVLRLPRGVLLALIALVGSGLLYLVPLLLAFWLVLFFPDAAGSRWSSALVMLPFCAVPGWFFYHAWRLLRRKVDYYQMRLALPLVILAAIPMALPLMSDFGIDDAAQAGLLALFSALSLAVGLLDLYVFFWLTRRSLDLLIWLPTGEAPEKLRARHRRSASRALPGERRPSSFRLHHAPADRAIAARIREALRRFGHESPGIGAADGADYDLIVLSAHTPYSLIERVLRTAQRPVSIVVSRVQIPDELSRLARYQWLDYRQQPADLLYELSVYMGTTASTSRPRDLYAIPEALDKPLTPRRITTMVDIVKAVLGVIVFIIGFSLLVQAYTHAPGSSSLRWSLLLTLVTLAGDIWYINALVNRRISLEAFQILLWINLGWMIVNAFTQDAVWGILLGLVSTGVAAWIYLRAFHPHVREWLPRRADRTREPTLQARFVLFSTLGRAAVFAFMGLLVASSLPLGIMPAIFIETLSDTAGPSYARPPTATPWTIRATATPVTVRPTVRPPTAVPGAPASGWQTVSSEEGAFSVLMPGEPKTERSTQSTWIGDIELVSFSVEKSDGLYMVAYADYPAQTLSLGDADAGLEGAVQGAVGNVNGVLSSKEDITLDGYPGKAFVARATASGVEMVLKARIYLVGDRLYQLLAVERQGLAASTDAARFLESFELLGADHGN